MNQQSGSAQIYPLIGANQRVGTHITHFSFAHKNFPELGKIFGIVAVHNSGRDNAAVIHNIVRKIQKFYFGNLDEEAIANINHAKQFEDTLQKLNSNLYEYFSDASVDIAPSDLQVFIGLIHPQKNSFRQGLHFSTTGGVSAFLLHKSQINTYTMAEILGPSTDDENRNIAKIFSNLLSGEVSSSDYVFFAFDEVLEYMNKESLQSIITTLPIETSLNHIRKILDDVQEKSSAFLLIKPEKYKPAVARAVQRPVSEVTSQESINTLLGTEKETEKILSPAGGVGISKMMNRISETTKDLLRKAGGAKTERPAMQSDGPMKSKNLPEAMKKTYKSVSESVKKKGKGFSFSGNAVKQFDIRVHSNNFVSTFSSLGERIQIWYKYMSPYNRIIFAIIIVLALVFAQSLYSNARKNKLAQENQKYESVIAQAKDLANEAEGAVIYQHDKAGELKNQSIALLETLPADLPGFESQITSIWETLNTVTEKIKKEVPVSPQLIADFEPQNPEINLAAAYVIDDTIIALPKNETAFYTASRQAGDLSKKQLPETIGTILGSTADEGIVYFAHTAGGFASLDPTTGDVTAITSQLNEGTNVPAIAYYSQGIYSVQPSDNQLIRRTRLSADRYTDGAGWIKEAGVDLSNVISVAIDGSIYFLRSDGSIDRFRTGFIQSPPLELGPAEPPLQSAAGLYTSEDTNTIFVSDPSNKRILAWDKSGSFINQYTAEEFSDIRSFRYDAASNSLYVLSGSKVYDVKLP